MTEQIKQLWKRLPGKVRVALMAITVTVPLTIGGASYRVGCNVNFQPIDGSDGNVLIGSDGDTLKMEFLK